MTGHSHTRPHRLRGRVDYGAGVTFLRPAADPVAAVEQVDGWLAAADPAPLLVETSGSTGRPKRVVLGREAVVASARGSAERLGELGLAPGRWALWLPSAYVAGIQVIVRSLLAGHRPELGAWGEADYTSLVPTQLTRLLTDPGETERLRRLQAVLVGGGPVDRDLRRRASEAGVRTIATYGAAETAGGCVYDGMPLTGVGVAVGADRRIRLAGPTLFEGYHDDPEQTRAALVDGWYLTSDAGRIDEDGRLQVLGRLDDMIVTGGLNVPGPAVAARLRAHPAVHEVEVLGVEDPEWGSRVVAFVVPAGDHAASASLAELRDWVAAELPRSWAPRQVVTLPELPMLGNGKPDRVALRRSA